MPPTLTLKPDIALGIVPTHIKFVGGLVPDENGNLPREEDGRLSTVAEMDRICRQSPFRPTCTQIPFFSGTNESDAEEMVSGMKELDLEVHFVLFVGGANPMDPADEDDVVGKLVGSLEAAQRHGIVSVSSTSIEEWMNGPENMDLDTAVAQNVVVHARAVRESGLLESGVTAWHIEFLRPGEFKTFTDLKRAWAFVKAVNREIGRDFFKLLVDAAHMGDSGLSILESQELIAEIAAAGHLGIYHASSPTTRGCLSTDDGWIGATLSAAAKTGKLEMVFVEVFHHEDPALEALRNLDSGHGIDTCDGRSYTEVTIDGLVSIARRLNTLSARGFL
ncbi:MAG: hypothetical protein V4727_06840 [Verrucomicrobiota bacterium]